MPSCSHCLNSDSRVSIQRKLSSSPPAFCVRLMKNSTHCSPVRSALSSLQRNWQSFKSPAPSMDTSPLYQSLTTIQKPDQWNGLLIIPQSPTSSLLLLNQAHSRLIPLPLTHPVFPHFKPYPFLKDIVISSSSKYL